MLLVILVVLLLIGLFWEEEAEQVEHIFLEENPGIELPQTEAEDENLIYRVSSEEVDRKGWWNILAQIEYEYRPERLTVSGEFSEKRFKGTRPKLNMDINWQAVDLLQIQKKTLAACK
ncbi:MAG: hypothetical protein U5K71_10650 [Gracilimonas sp.]|nr:hypothetical protein [Gracilimonas sp.]